MARYNEEANRIDRLVAVTVDQLRISRGITTTQLGDACGVSFQQIGKYLKGVNRLSVGRLYQMAKLLNKPVSYFFDCAASDVITESPSQRQAMVVSRDFQRIKNQGTKDRIAALIKDLAE